MSKDISQWTMQQVVDEINKLAKIKKERSLTEQESQTRELLKQRYLELFRQNFKQQLSNIKVVDENNNDITSEKIKKLREAKKW
ncbi:DUF896 domain-containing protein [Mycoplasma yeatsii]|uniref:Uncharacterized protein n=2 Tax=Mycoplasma yeatsii TaxID=51365 RepID=S6G8E2_9MOLU|nr:DUF896 domain-containing protein [Mycoplasma yeatsii]AJM71725.1 hypothetical protein MYE_01185 [Mycoplasma yeatsii GM274B]EOA07399.1 Hypothetical protein MYEA_1970 [Mycoplasma yeatsii 13926]MDQ0568106.1 uncharacterized protein YnzC (UPF0291/DUF896 family) [Mycoplasma yeatsii]